MTIFGLIRGSHRGFWFAVLVLLAFLKISRNVQRCYGTLLPQKVKYYCVLRSNVNN